MFKILNTKECAFLCLHSIETFNPRTYEQIHVVDGTPPRSFRYVGVFWNDFTFSGKPLILLTWWGIFYGWWHWGLWRNQQWLPSWSPCWILPRIGNQVKTVRNGNFFVLYMKNNTYINTLHDFNHKIYFYCWKKLKKHVISPKIGLITCYLWGHISES